MEPNRAQTKPLSLLEPTSAPQKHPEDRKCPDLTNKRMEVGRFRSDKHGDIVIIYLSDVETGDIEGIRWDEASSVLQQAARRLAVDPLGLLRIQDAAVPSNSNTPTPCAPVAQTHPTDEPYFSETTPLSA